MTICLLGFMGSGKSTVGKRLAKRLNFSFYDLDAEIEKAEKQTIVEIFAQKGENYFRKIERKLLLKFLDKPDIVLSLGGGTPCFFDNMLKIREKAYSIYLNLPVETLAQRLENAKQTRPLAAGKTPENLRFFIADLLHRREGFYLQADVKINAISLKINDLYILLKKNKALLF